MKLPIPEYCLARRQRALSVNCGFFDRSMKVAQGGICCSTAYRPVRPAKPTPFAVRVMDVPDGS